VRGRLLWDFAHDLAGESGQPPAGRSDRKLPAGPKWPV